MSGCSLQEAFPDTEEQSGQKARKHEREKAKRCGGPALAFLKASTMDPDRQNLSPLPPAERMEGREGFTAKKTMEGFAAQDAKNRKYMPVKVSDVEQNDRELVNSLVGQQVNDVIGQQNLPIAAESQNELPDFEKTQYGDPVPSYFGKSIENDGFADFSASMTDNPGYEIRGSDFAASFGQKGLDKATGKEVLPIPAINNVWKPITPSGVNTAFLTEHAATARGQQKDGVFSNEEKTALLRKLDTLFARLDDIESKRNENSNAEITLFIVSGLILMFGLETVRKI